MVNIIKEISTGQANLIKSFAIFYLLIIVGFVSKSLITCDQIRILENHRYFQLFIGFLLFYFLVTLVSNVGLNLFIPPIQKLFYTIFYFFGFLISMRLDFRITTIVFFLIFIIYFFEINKNYYLETDLKITNNFEKKYYNDHHYWITLDWPYKIRLFPVVNNQFIILNKIENIVFYIILFLLIIGFISYGGEIKETIKIKKSLTWEDIIINTNICYIKDKKSFWYYFKKGLEIKF